MYRISSRLADTKLLDYAQLLTDEEVNFPEEVRALFDEMVLRNNTYKDADTCTNDKSFHYFSHHYPLFLSNGFLHKLINPLKSGGTTLVKIQIPKIVTRIPTPTKIKPAPANKMPTTGDAINVAIPLIISASPLTPIATPATITANNNTATVHKILNNTDKTAIATGPKIGNAKMQRIITTTNIPPLKSHFFLCVVVATSSLSYV